jgi:hypothetical protein
MSIANTTISCRASSTAAPASSTGTRLPSLRKYDDIGVDQLADSRLAPLQLSIEGAGFFQVRGGNSFESPGAIETFGQLVGERSDIDEAVRSGRCDG